MNNKRGLLSSQFLRFRGWCWHQLGAGEGPPGCDTSLSESVWEERSCGQIGREAEVPQFLLRASYQLTLGPPTSHHLQTHEPWKTNCSTLFPEGLRPFPSPQPLCTPLGLCSSLRSLWTSTSHLCWFHCLTGVRDVIKKRCWARHQAPVACTCNPSYSRGRDQEDCSSKPAPGK
jgi:hypothetical protein